MKKKHLSESWLLNEVESQNFINKKLTRPDDTAQLTLRAKGHVLDREGFEYTVCLLHSGRGRQIFRDSSYNTHSFIEKILRSYGDHYEFDIDMLYLHAEGYKGAVGGFRYYIELRLPQGQGRLTKHFVVEDDCFVAENGRTVTGGMAYTKTKDGLAVLLGNVHDKPYLIFDRSR